MGNVHNGQRQRERGFGYGLLVMGFGLRGAWLTAHGPRPTQLRPTGRGAAPYSLYSPLPIPHPTHHAYVLFSHPASRIPYGARLTAHGHPSTPYSLLFLLYYFHMNGESSSGASRKILVVLALLLFIVALVLVILQSSIFRQVIPQEPQIPSENLNGNREGSATNTSVIIPDVPPSPSQEAFQNLLNPPSSQEPSTNAADPNDPNNTIFKETPGEHGTQPSGQLPPPPIQVP